MIALELAPNRARLLAAMNIMYDRLGGQFDAQSGLDPELLENRFWAEAEGFRRSHDPAEQLRHFWAMVAYGNEIIAREYAVEIVYEDPDQDEGE